MTSRAELDHLHLLNKCSHLPYTVDGKSVSNAAKMNIGNDTVAGAVIEKLGNDGVLEKSKSTSRRSLLDIVALANKVYTQQFPCKCTAGRITISCEVFRQHAPQSIAWHCNGGTDDVK